MRGINETQEPGEYSQSNPSDSMSERARELREKLAVKFGCLSGGDPSHAPGVCGACIHADLAMLLFEPALADAFNLGAGGAFEAAAQVCDGNYADWLAKLIRQRISSDFLAAVERIRGQAVAEVVASWRQKYGGPWITTDPIEAFKLLNEIYNEGFEEAHDLRVCGHSRGDYRDLGYISGKPETYTASEECVGCQQEERKCKAAYDSGFVAGVELALRESAPPTAPVSEPHPSNEDLDAAVGVAGPSELTCKLDEVFANLGLGAKESTRLLAVTIPLVELALLEARLEQVETALAVAHAYSENSEDAGLAALEYLMLRKCELQTAIAAASKK